MGLKDLSNIEVGIITIFVTAWVMWVSSSMVESKVYDSGIEARLNAIQLDLQSIKRFHGIK